MSEPVRPPQAIPTSLDGVRMVCYACLGSNWSLAKSQHDWVCADCGHRKAMMLSGSRLAALWDERKRAALGRVKAKREATD